MVQLHPVGLLGGHVGYRPHGLVQTGELGAVGQQGQPEVHDGDESLGARARDHQVGRLDVSVNDLFLVRCLESSRRLDRDIERVLQLERPGLDLLLQRLAFEKGHGNEGLAFDFIDLVDVADVGVIECGGRFRLSPEPRLNFLVAEQVSRQEFQSYRTLEVRVLSLVNDTHAALAELPGDLVVRDGSVDHAFPSNRIPRMFTS